jgi:hypothetical protein
MHAKLDARIVRARAPLRFSCFVFPSQHRLDTSTSPPPPKKVQGKSVTQCAGAAPECAALRATLFHCKRAAVDARSRIQGNKLDR